MGFIVSVRLAEKNASGENKNMIETSEQGWYMHNAAARIRRQADVDMARAIDM